jgi:hypothetical protein
VGPGRRWWDGIFQSFKLGRLVEFDSPLLFEFAEPAADAGEHGSVGVVVGFESLDKPGLALLDLFDGQSSCPTQSTPRRSGLRCSNRWAESDSRKDCQQRFLTLNRASRTARST